MSADCVSVHADHGRNLTPISILGSARFVLGGIELDPASDPYANESVGAERFYSLDEDGLSQDWRARTLWLNPPGQTQSNGKQVSASDWFRKAYSSFLHGRVHNVLGLVYRAGSVGSLGEDLLNDAVLCLTCALRSRHPAINGSGRLSFEKVIDGVRVPQTSNTQSSVFFLLSRNEFVRARFMAEFRKYGVVL